MRKRMAHEKTLNMKTVKIKESHSANGNFAARMKVKWKNVDSAKRKSRILCFHVSPAKIRLFQLPYMTFYAGLFANLFLFRSDSLFLLQHSLVLLVCCVSTFSSCIQDEW